VTSASPGVSAGPSLDMRAFGTAAEQLVVTREEAAPPAFWASPAPPLLQAA